MPQSPDVPVVPLTMTPAQWEAVCADGPLFPMDGHPYRAMLIREVRAQAAKLAEVEYQRDAHYRARGSSERLLVETERKLAAVEAERDALKAATTDLVEDLESRWDMRSPSTNPGIKTCVARAKTALDQRLTAKGE